MPCHPTIPPSRRTRQIGPQISFNSEDYVEKELLLEACLMMILRGPFQTVPAISAVAAVSLDVESRIFIAIQDQVSD